jgi:hypothetical protein
VKFGRGRREFGEGFAKLSKQPEAGRVDAQKKKAQRWGEGDLDTERMGMKN